MVGDRTRQCLTVFADRIRATRAAESPEQGGASARRNEQTDRWRSDTAAPGRESRGRMHHLECGVKIRGGGVQWSSREASPRRVPRGIAAGCPAMVPPTQRDLHERAVDQTSFAGMNLPCLRSATRLPRPHPPMRRTYAHVAQRNPQDPTDAASTRPATPRRSSSRRGRTVGGGTGTRETSLFLEPEEVRGSSWRSLTYERLAWLGRDASGHGRTRSGLRCNLEGAAQCGDTV
jgi:hypothetical protein